jgi:DNA-binding NarL/FixJ family response regulator
MSPLDYSPDAKRVVHPVDGTAPLPAYAEHRVGTAAEFITRQMLLADTDLPEAAAILPGETPREVDGAQPARDHHDEPTVLDAAQPVDAVLPAAGTGLDGVFNAGDGRVASAVGREALGITASYDTPDEKTAEAPGDNRGMRVDTVTARPKVEYCAKPVSGNGRTDSPNEETPTSDAGARSASTTAETASDQPVQRAGDHSDGGNPPEDTPRPEHNDDDDRSLWELEGPALDAELARRFERDFSVTVPTLKREIDELVEAGGGPEDRPDFIGWGGVADTGVFWLAAFRVGTTENPDDKRFVFRMLQDETLREEYEIEEEGRRRALLKGTKLRTDTRDDIEQIVAHNDGFGSITGYAGVPLEEMAQAEWGQATSYESLRQLHAVVTDMLACGIRPDIAASDMVWNRDRGRIVLIDYRIRTDGFAPEEGELEGMQTDPITLSSYVFPNLVAEGLLLVAPEVLGVRMSRQAFEIAEAYRREHGPIAEAAEEDEVTAQAREAYLARTYQINMPELGAVSGGRLVLLDYEAQEQVRLAARDSIDLIYGRDLQLNELERALLTSLARGRERWQIEEDRPEGPIITYQAYDRLTRRLVVVNEAQMVYVALLHGIDIGAVPASLSEAPRLTRNEQLHLYLVAAGYDQERAAQLTGRRIEAVQRHYADLMHKFQASSMAQVIAHAFAVGHFVPLPPEPEGVPTDSIEEGQVSDVTTAQQLRNISRADPVPGSPTYEASGRLALRLPHDCVIEYTERPWQPGQPRVVDIQSIGVPVHLRGHHRELGQPSISQRLMDALRDRCIAAGIDRINGVVTHPGALVARVLSFGLEHITMRDENWQRLATLEEAIAYLVQGRGNRDVFVTADLGRQGIR